MPEGHTIHRAARDHGRVLAGQVLAVSSPQGRFAEGAALIDGRRCVGVEAYGKHLLYRFDSGDALHIHLGLFGRLRKQKLPLSAPRGAVRVRLVGKSHVVDVNGPNICRLLDPPQIQSLVERIGPDVLRSDADPERAFKRIAKSRAPIGRLIMDQSVMAGIGNIYRSEILWRQGIHPETPGRDIGRDRFDRIWNDAKALLAIGVKHDAIITVERVAEGAAPSKARTRERVNIFGKASCPTCGQKIRRFEIDGRRAFACEACQPSGAGAGAGAGAGTGSAQD
ncbi:Fpg/Nei family DNA glycosylase [Denitrobaculum tricleocarpae]|uniref:DNA-(apurinic or apyrimidinic site) lyase n=1 Tax=Denitrobaculum tricleocarpae TaxID=2591009 RepID=A0A545SZ97_9PROT|nr:DNA-formamidopyrimidine glycosylase family protein [Denitrobaculum tricleocarpae]TQV70261.1 Fpg/Nei family DNA glycosylase [Denitrobaculum tricleocarpae]